MWSWKVSPIGWIRKLHSSLKTKFWKMWSLIDGDQFIGLFVLIFSVNCYSFLFLIRDVQLLLYIGILMDLRIKPHWWQRSKFWIVWDPDSGSTIVKISGPKFRPKIGYSISTHTWNMIIWYLLYFLLLQFHHSIPYFSPPVISIPCLLFLKKLNL